MESTLTVDSLAEQAETLEARYDAALERVRKGEEWLRTHPQRHPQYAEAQALLAQRRGELAQIEAEFDGTLKEMVTTARQDWPAKSVNCLLCGKPVAGYPAPQPGYYVHIECSEAWDVKREEEQCTQLSK